MPAVAKIRDTRIEEQLYFVKEISVLKFWLLSLVLEKLEWFRGVANRLFKKDDLKISEKISAKFPLLI